MLRCRDGAMLARLAGAVAPLRRRFAVFPAALALFAILGSAAPVSAQDRQIFQLGATAVTGFSGAGASAEPAASRFIDPNGVSLRVFDLSSPGGPAGGQAADGGKPFEVVAGQVGQVFGLAFDDGGRDGTPSGAPDLYVAATSLYGVHIVGRDAKGQPHPQQRGVPGAAFMSGQFGEEGGGGPGTIWRIDGLTGAVSKFADIGTNSGPAIGNIAFDPAQRQFFASDLDTGLIHRIDASGALIDSFDHGVVARPKAGLAAVKDDGKRMEISSPAFDGEDPATWAYTQAERRVWGVAVDDGRLFYAVGDKAEIWSVGIGDGGRFAEDARREFVVRAGSDLPVTDIAFDDRGGMYLAQRGKAGNAAAGKAEVLRYSRDGSGAWVAVPVASAAGPAAGGVALQYGYDAQGRFDRASCFGSMAATGEETASGGTGVVLMEPAKGGAPANSRFVRLGATSADVGDVAVWHPCKGTANAQAPTAATGVAVATARIAGTSAEAVGKPSAALQVELTGDATCQVGKPCSFEIQITNPASVPFEGPVRFGDAIAAAGIGRLEDVAITSIEPPLGCRPAAAKLPLSCTGGGGLGGGSSSTHKMTVVIAAAAIGGAVSPIAAQNCFAAVPPGATVAGLAGGAAAPGGPGGGGPFACHRFTIEIPKDGGGQCTLLPGQIRTKEGRCICRKGTSLVDGKCAPARQPACKVSGQVRGKNGVCACPRGTQAVNGACRKPPRGCPAGSTSINGRCVLDSTNGGCIAGEIFVNGQCMIVESCPRGTVGEYPNCRPAPRLLHVPSDRADRPERQGGGRDPTGGNGQPGSTP